MNDNEIIKALECCANWESDKSCEDCPANTYGFGCANKRAKYSLDLINRQKSEIDEIQHKFVSCNSKKEELEIELKAMRGAANSYKAEVERLKAEQECEEGYADALIAQSKSEAIKEFAERLKEKAKIEWDTQIWRVKRDEIDNLVKEMTENDFKE